MNPGQQFGTARALDWKQWEGQVVDGAFPLRSCLRGGRLNAVFLTEFQGQNAAIKLVAEDPRNAEAQLAQWQSASQLSHPHLIRLLHCGRARLGGDGSGGAAFLYVVMEWAEENLAEVLPQRPLTPAEALEMLQPAVSALAYLHREGFVHGRLKPANVLAVQSQSGDQLKISSDGLQRFSEAGASEDVRALGAMLVEALTQRPPHAAREPKLPEPFRTVVRHCLEPKPEQRWTVSQVEDSLRRPVTGAAWWKSPGWRPAAALVAMGLTVLVFWVGSRASKDRPDATVAPPALSEALKTDPAATQKQPPREDSSAAVPEVLAVQKKPPRTDSSAAVRAAPKQPPLPDSSASAPGVLQQVLPEVSPQARGTIHGKVRVNVSVKVDPSGSVMEAKIAPPSPGNYFSGLGLKAARQWKFEPSSSVQAWTVRFEITAKDIQVSSRRVSLE